MSSQKRDNFFNINSLEGGVLRYLADGIKTYIFSGENAMISIVRIAPNAEGILHSHSQEQWGYLIEGSVTRIQDGVSVDAKKGDFWRTPPDVEHGIIGGPDGAIIFDIFAPIREEYLRPGTGFGVEK